MYEFKLLLFIHLSFYYLSILTIFFFVEYFVNFSTEVSDQNFVDEDQGAKLSCESVRKRLKTSADDASSSDQVTLYISIRNQYILELDSAFFIHCRVKAYQLHNLGHVVILIVGELTYVYIFRLCHQRSSIQQMFHLLMIHPLKERNKDAMN